MTALQEIKCQNCRINRLCLPVMLAEQEMDRLDSIIQRKKPLKKGQNLYSAGESFSHVYAIRSGCLKTYTITAEGEEQITGFHLPGEIVGLEAINHKQHQGFTQALTPTEICSIPYLQLDELSASIPGLRQQMVNIMSREISENYELMLLLNQKTAEQKLSAFLINLGVRQSSQAGITRAYTLLMTRSDIANYLGLTLETVSRIVSKLTKEGLLEINKREVELLDIPKLSQLAGTSCHF